MPFLYSDRQILNIEDEKDSYHLKFNIESYNEENLSIRGKFLNSKILSNCQVKEKEIICEIKKEELIKILPREGGNLFLYYSLSDDFLGDIEIQQYPNVLNITVNIENIDKEDIYIGINKFMYIVLKQGNFVPFETNVTNVSNLITEEFKITEEEYSCFLKKEINNPLLILCTGFKSGIYSLEELFDEEIILNNINVKYNFRIQPTKNLEKFEISGSDSEGYLNYAFPKILDFTLKDELKIYFFYKGIGSFPSFSFSDLKLAPDLEKMKCDRGTSGKSFYCTINSGYFANSANRYYNLGIYKEFYQIYYELPSFEVILPKTKSKSIKIKIFEAVNQAPFIIGENGGALFLISNYNDNERNIFNSSDIEEKTKFETIIYDSYR